MPDSPTSFRPWLELHEYLDRNPRWTCQTLAEATGFAPNYIGYMLRGHRRVTPNAIRAAADALEVPYSVLKPHPAPRQEHTPWRELNTYIAVDKHWTSRALADRAGITEQRLRELRDGAITPSAHDIHTLANALKLPPSLLTPQPDDDEENHAA